MEYNLGFNFVPERIMPGLIGVFERSYSAVSEHANKTGHYPHCDEVKFIDRDSHWHSRRDKEAIHMRLHPNNINRGQWNWDSWSVDAYNQTTWQLISTASDCWGISYFLSQWQQCFGLKPWARFVIHQSLTTTMVQIVRLSKSTLSPDEDLQCAVETSRSISKWQSWVKR